MMEEARQKWEEKVENEEKRAKLVKELAEIDKKLNNYQNEWAGFFF